LNNENNDMFVTLTKNLNLFCRNSESNLVNFTGSVPHKLLSHQITASSFICAYAFAYVNNETLAHIDINNTFRKIIEWRSTKIQNVSRISLPVKYKLSLRKELITSILSNADNLSLNDAYCSFMAHVCKLNDLHTPTTVNMSSKSLKSRIKEDSVFFNALFLKSPKRAFDLMMDDSIVDDEPAKENLINNFNYKSKQPDPINWSKCPRINRAEFDLNFSPFMPKEISKVLSKLKNSTAGEDGVSYSNLKFADPECLFICFLFNKIVLINSYPLTWESFKTLMIPKPGKDGHYNEVSSWRPIALLNTTYKLFTACVTNRISNWLFATELLHPMQKSIGKHEGCIEHNFVLASVVEKFYNSETVPVYLVFLDIADAFGSVPVECIVGILDRMGVDKIYQEIITSLYCNAKSKYMCGSTVTEHLDVKRGVRQGCPLSMLLFNIAMNPILEACDAAAENGVCIGHQRLSCFAYADDIAFIARSVPILQNMVQIAVDIAAWAQMEFRPEKCGFLPLQERYTGNSISIGNKIIPLLIGKDIYKYLGVNFGRKIDKTPSEVTNNVTKIVLKINDSTLVPWQKINCYQIFGHSKLLFLFRTSYFCRKTFDQSTKTISNGLTLARGIDLEVRAMVRRALNLNSTSPIDYFYIGRKQGGLGLVKCADEYAIQKVVQGFRMLSCSCQTVRIIARTMLSFQYQKFTTSTENNLSNHEILSNAINWLNSDGGIRKTDSPWYWIRDCVAYLKSDLKINIEFYIQNDDIYLRITHKFQDEINIANFKPNQRHLVCPTLHDLVGKAHLERFGKFSFSGKLAPSFPMFGISISAIRNGELSPKEWYFIHPARVNNLPVNSKPYGTVSKACRKCDCLHESQAHVLCHCPPGEGIVKNRHNEVLRMLTQFLRSKTNLRIILEERCEFSLSNLKIDLQIFDYANRRLFLIDVKTPYDEINNINKAMDSNILYYTEMKNECISKLLESKENWSVTLSTFVVGCLGSWHPGNFSILRDIGIHDNAINSVARKLSIICIKGAYKSWAFHSRSTNENGPQSSLSVSRFI